jgi:hypothetical protein
VVTKICVRKREDVIGRCRKLSGNKDIVRKREEVVGRCRKLYSEVLHNLFSKIIIEISKSKRVRWVGHMTFFGNEETGIKDFGWGT